VIVLKINRRRKRAIAKAEKEMDRYEQWKDFVEAVGGSLQKGKDGKLYGVLRVD
jgi:hypothetical protein